MKKINYILLVLGIVASASCKKAIEVDPTSNITSPDFFKTQDDATGALRGMYVELRVPAANDMFFLGEGRSEVLTGGTAGTLGNDKYYNNSLNVSNPGPNWQSFYTTINAANLLIKYVPTITFTSADTRNSILAQAYTMRACVYFVLVRSWGGVPIRTEPMESYDPAAVQKARSSAADVFTLIKDDLNKALALYPNMNYDTGRDTWSKGSADALKADVYLWTGKLMGGGQADFTTALNALNEAQTSDVQLLPNYSDIFSYTNKGNKEEMMAVRFQLNEGLQNYWQTMYVSNLSNIPAATSAIIGVQGVGNTGVNAAQISALVRNQFSTDDQRRAGTFLEIYDNAGKYVTSITTKGAGMVNAGTRNFFTDVILYRYADVLLMKAEAENALGMDPSNEINLVRKRAYGTNYANHVFVSTTKDANDAAILQERLLELATEGKRWWDLVRFGQVFNLVPNLQGKQSQTYLLLFPIGNTIRSLEPLVTENPGWQ